MASPFSARQPKSTAVRFPTWPDMLVVTNRAFDYLSMLERLLTTFDLNVTQPMGIPMQGPCCQVKRSEEFITLSDRFCLIHFGSVSKGFTFETGRS